MLLQIIINDRLLISLNANLNSLNIIIPEIMKSKIRKSGNQFSLITTLVVILLLSTTIEAKKKTKDTNEELLLVVEVSRHGARSPSKIFDLAHNPEENFKNKSELTLFGRY
jgi:hypothetical protein